MRLIDADALKAWFFRPYSNEESYSNVDVEKAIDAQPTIEPERKKGKWIVEVKHYKDAEQEYYYIEEHCSECGAKRKIGWSEANYCPNCGCELMRQEGEEHG